jgi:hypothetical protein
MTWTISRFRTGELIEVRSREEILATLDHQGRLEKLPFMPEMLKYCGRQFRVGAVAHKTCDWVIAPGTSRRVETTVHLEGLRCDGSSHGGCEAECNLFWKDAWLKPVSERTAGSTERRQQDKKSQETYTEEQLTRDACVHEVEGAEARYVCQATQIGEASEPLEAWDIRQYFYDVRTGNRPAGPVMRFLFLSWFRWLLKKLPFGYRAFKVIHDHMHRMLAGRAPPSVHGRIPDGMPTPSGVLDLRQGEYVRIKSQSEIEETIDRKWKNRGLSFDPEEMAPFCGDVAKVHRRVTRIVDEKTGKLLNMKQPCITLDGVICKGDVAAHRLNCPRAIPSYWREIWLERTQPNTSSDTRSK